MYFVREQTDERGHSAIYTITPEESVTEDKRLVRTVENVKGCLYRKVAPQTRPEVCETFLSVFKGHICPV